MDNVNLDATTKNSKTPTLNTQEARIGLGFSCNKENIQCLSATKPVQNRNQKMARLENIVERLQKEDVSKTVCKTEKPFKCELCPNTFAQLRNKKRHMKLIHNATCANSSERPYKCQQCIKSFSSNFILNRHTKSVHDGICYDCKFCNKSFSFKHNLTRHMRTAHSKDLENSEVKPSILLTTPTMNLDYKITSPPGNLKINMKKVSQNGFDFSIGKLDQTNVMKEL